MEYLALNFHFFLQLAIVSDQLFLILFGCFIHNSWSIASFTVALVCLLVFLTQSVCLITPLRLWLLLLSASPLLPTKYPSDHWSQNPKRLCLSDAAGDYRNRFFKCRDRIKFGLLGCSASFFPPLLLLVTLLVGFWIQLLTWTTNLLRRSCGSWR